MINSTVQVKRLPFSVKNNTRFLQIREYIQQTKTNVIVTVGRKDPDIYLYFLEYNIFSHIKITKQYALSIKDKTQVIEVRIASLIKK